MATRVPQLLMSIAHVGAPLVDDAARMWWASFLRGSLGALFGVYAAFWSELSVLALALTWGLYATLRATVGVLQGVRARWWTMVAASIPLVVAGVFVLASPDLEADALRRLIGSVGIATGLLEVIAGLDLRRVLQADGTLPLSGAAAVTASIFLLATPTYGVLAVAWLIGTLAMVDAILSFGMARTLRDNRRRARRVADRALGVYRMPHPQRSASREAGEPDRDV